MLSWMNILRAMPKKVPASLIAVALILSLTIAAVWVRERDPERNTLGVIASTQYALRDVPETRMPENQQRIQDCDRWTGMNLIERRSSYRTDPDRWTRCLCKEEDCAFDLLYVTGELSR